jgi:hypothetical protein
MGCAFNGAALPGSPLCFDRRGKQDHYLTPARRNSLEAQRSQNFCHRHTPTKSDNYRSLKRHMGLAMPLDKPSDFTRGHESFDYAQDPEVLEGQGRMASLSPGIQAPYAHKLALARCPCGGQAHRRLTGREAISGITSDPLHGYDFDHLLEFGIAGENGGIVD